MSDKSNLINPGASVPPIGLPAGGREAADEQADIMLATRFLSRARPELLNYAEMLHDLIEILMSRRRAAREAIVASYGQPSEAHSPGANTDGQSQKLEAWIANEYVGLGRAIRREGDAPFPGEPYMSMDEAKELTRRAVKLFAATPSQAGFGEKKP